MSNQRTDQLLPYNPAELPRETARHYIPASEQELLEMLGRLGLNDLEELFAEVDSRVRFASPPALPQEKEYEETAAHLLEISRRNKLRPSFIGDGLPIYRPPEIVRTISSIRALATSYTPYQPERSQGTLITHWIYQCAMTMLTGFEAINSSLYDRATALFEAAVCAIRLSKGKTDTILVSSALYPGDLEVLRTIAADTRLRIVEIPFDAKSGQTSPETCLKLAQEAGDRLAAITFSQVNTFGIIEDVDSLTNIAKELDVKSIAVIDPMHLASGGLKPPSRFGRHGASMFVGEGQHLAIGPNFGGPGLGIFGVRHNERTPSDVRATPGRYVGKAQDLHGRPCITMVLSTREQHIRRDRATSNICSNQAFLATLAGAAILERGEAGMQAACQTGRDRARTAAEQLSRHPGVSLAFARSAFFNEFVVTLPVSAADCIAAARELDLHVGVDVSNRIPGSNGNHLKLSFSDWQTDDDLRKLSGFFAEAFGPAEPDKPVHLQAIPVALQRDEPVGLPNFARSDLEEYYRKLGELNVSPDDACYPLGSCTMKYNPHLNEFAAGLAGFTDAHPQTPIEDAQGCLEVLYEIQEWFKAITGLPGVTTQPVAGAQGELVGLKLFQAYHRSRGDTARDIVLIPRSSHGTNFATAAMAGFETKVVDGNPTGIVLLDADATGQVDPESVREKVARFGNRIAGIMITNPNTSGIFESRFREVADLIHDAGGLVYMDGANMNAIAGWVDLNALGVDAVHNNLHKTWTIPHGGGGPGDAIVAVSVKLVDFLPGLQIRLEKDRFVAVRPARTIGSFHRHWGNFAHKVRAYTYLARLGKEGVRRMSAVAVLSARYVQKQLEDDFPILPAGAGDVPRMHEFILTLPEDTFEILENAGVPKANIIPQVGKLFLDFGYHSPTVAFPETFGLMIEPTESYTRGELDRFVETIKTIGQLLREHPEVAKTAPHFTPIDRVDEVRANRSPALSEPLAKLPEIPVNRIDPKKLLEMPPAKIVEKIVAAAKSASKSHA